MKTALLIHLAKSSKSHFEGSLNDDDKPEFLKWNLLSIDSKNEFRVLETGNSSIQDMPVADQAIAIMAGQDVRLIELNLPLVNSKKLQQLLPNLIEDYLLGSPSNYLLHILPPNDGAAALLRTVAVINKELHERISEALAQLNVQSIQIIPETLCLSEGILGYQTGADFVSFTKRHGPQTGDSWSEISNNHQETIKAAMSITNAQSAKELSLDSLIPGAIQLIDSHINLLAKIPKRKQAFKFSNHESRWSDKNLWSSSIQWFGIFITSAIIGLNSYFAGLVIADWRWKDRMTAAANVAVGEKNEAPIKTLVLETTRLLHVNGLGSVSDIDHLSSKIYLFVKSLGQDSVKRIQYNGSNIEFELKQSVDKQLLKKKIAEMRLNIEVLNQTSLRIYPLPMMNDEAK
jgi:hypothetical protein